MRACEGCVTGQGGQGGQGGLGGEGTEGTPDETKKNVGTFSRFVRVILAQGPC